MNPLNLPLNLPFLGRGNPQGVRCEPLIRIVRPRSQKIGDHSLHYAAMAGVAEGDFHFEHGGLGLLVSGTTKKMDRPDNQDAIYAASISSRKSEFNWAVLVMADGVSGAPGGSLAASAFIQGAHLAVVKSIQDPRLRDPSKIFLEGAVAFRYQRREHQYKEASTTGLVMAISSSGVKGAYRGDTIPILCSREGRRTQVEPHSERDRSNVLTASVADGQPPVPFEWPWIDGDALYGATDGALTLMSVVLKELLPSQLIRGPTTADALLEKWIKGAPEKLDRDNCSLSLVRKVSTRKLMFF